MPDNTKITVSKLEAATRQLHCAIELWFRGADVISTHTLARAAYDIIHDMNEHKGMSLDLLYNSDLIKDEHQAKWAAGLRAPGNFAKHADRDPNGKMSFSSDKNLGFIIFAIRGLSGLGVPPSTHITALTLWLAMTNSEFLKPEIAKTMVNRLPMEHLARLKAGTKEQFVEAFTEIADEGPPIGL